MRTRRPWSARAVQRDLAGFQVALRQAQRLRVMPETRRSNLTRAEIAQVTHSGYRMATRNRRRLAPILQTSPRRGAQEAVAQAGHLRWHHRQYLRPNSEAAPARHS